MVVPGLWLVFLTGCAETIHPPVNPTDPATIYVADYGRHSSILLPEKNGGYVEWAFGDWRWFALGQTKADVALAAILSSPQSTLGRREVPPQPDEEALKRTLEADRLIPVVVSGERAEALEDKLQQRYEKHIQTQVHSDYSNLDHVKDCEHYWALNNCNHLTMRWLKKLGCRVDGFGMMSNFQLAK